MKKMILKIANSFLEPIGAKIVRKEVDDFDMPLAVQRISNHNFPIQSVIDIGASNGKWTLETMKVFPKASFLAIEPLSEREEALKIIKEKHSNFDYALCVAGETTGQEVQLNVSDDLDGSTVDAPGGKNRSVPVTTVDAVVAEKNLKGPFLLKFDTHGYELPILKGATETLQQTDVIIMEVYNFDITDHAIRYPQMCLHMENLGFRCYDIAGPLLRPHDQAFWQMDILFCRNSSKIFSHPHYK